MITRVCRDCGLSKPLDELAPDIRSKYGRKNLCTLCAAKRMREQRAKPTSKHLEKHREYRKKLRLEIIEKLGGICVVCGQDKEPYLQIDHVCNDGNAHRKQVGQEGVYNDIKRQGFPKDKYQILCANCHLAKTRGYNPLSLLNE